MTMLDAPTLTSVTETTFAAELAERIRPLQASLGAMLSEWGSPKSASALHRLSGAGQTICWQVFRIVNADDVVAEARHAPSPSSLRRLLAAALEAGVAEATVQSVREAAEAFQNFSKRAAGDRASFDSMLAGVTSDETAERILMSQRRSVYRGQSHVWGIQTDLQSFTCLIHRSASGDGTDSASFMVQRGTRRLRPESQVTIFSYYQNPSGMAGDVQSENAIDADAARQYGMPVLPQFSTSPLPQIEKVVSPTGSVMYNTIGREIGPRGSLDCTFARLSRNQPFATDSDGRRMYHQTLSLIRKPVGMLVQEILVHRPSFPNVRPELMVYQYPGGDVTQEAARRSMQFPVDERLTMVGRADRAGLADVPRYAEMLRLGATAAGWDLSEFDVYRVRMPYPIMFSAVRIFFYVD